MAIFHLILALLLTTSLAWAGKEERGDYREGMRSKREEFHSSRESDERAFRESLKGLSAEERVEALKAHHEERVNKREEFHSKMQTERLAELKSRLAKNTKMTDEQKKELVSFYEQQDQDAVSHHRQQAAENNFFLEKLASDESLTQEQRKAAIRAHFAGKKAENSGFRQDKKTENKAERVKIRNEAK